MTFLCLILDVHQPIKLNKSFPYERVKRIAEGSPVVARYFDEQANNEVFARLAQSCYKPVFTTLLNDIKESMGSSRPFKLSLNLSGPFLEQAVKYDPELVDLLKSIVKTKMVEIVGSTHFHSLASLYPDGKDEFVVQVKAHKELVKKLFDYDTKVFANTDYIYNDQIAMWVQELGSFQLIISEGVGRILQGSSPNYIYTCKGGSIKLLLRHTTLAEDVSLRFFKKEWSEYPLTAEKYSNWLSSAEGDVITLVWDVHIFNVDGPHSTRALDFLRQLVLETSKKHNLSWSLPSELVDSCPSLGTVLIPEPESISWLGTRKDVSPWLANPMQRISFDRLSSIRPYVAEINDEGVWRIWRLLQDADFIKYMSLQSFGKRSFDPYSSPFEAYAVFDSIFTDFEGKVATIVQKIRKSKAASQVPYPPRPSTGKTAYTSTSMYRY